MLAPGSYAEICSRFVWQVPAKFNIGVAVCDRWATGESRPALPYEDPAGNVRTYSQNELKALTDCLANVLAAHGIERGDRVGILLPQCPENASFPHRHLQDGRDGPTAVHAIRTGGALNIGCSIARQEPSSPTEKNLPKIDAIRSFLPQLRYILVVDGENGAHTDFWAALERASSNSPRLTPRARIPPSSSTPPAQPGSPRARSMPTAFFDVPGVQFPHEFFPQPGDKFWTPADWAWAGGLLDVLLPSLYFGIPVVAHEPASSTLNMLSISSPSTRCGTHSYRRLRSS